MNFGHLPIFVAFSPNQGSRFDAETFLQIRGNARLRHFTGVFPLASAQDIFTFTQEIETRFAEVETLRLNSNCPLCGRRLDDLSVFLAPFLFNMSKVFTERGKLEYRERLAEAAARTCPPQIIQPKPTPAISPPVILPPVVAAPSPAPLPRTVTLKDLRFELAEACGARFDPARERFIAALDRAIRFETNPRQRRYFEIDRAAVQRLKVPPCTSTRTASTESGADRWFRMQRFNRFVEVFNDKRPDSRSLEVRI